MLDKSIDGALLALRKRIIRGKLDGLEHVEALLGMRGVDMPRVLPAKNVNVAYRGHARMLISEALRDGPKPRAQIVAHIVEKRPDLPREAAYARTDRLLWKMKKTGLVCREDGMWRLTK